MCKWGWTRYLGQVNNHAKSYDTTSVHCCVAATTSQRPRSSQATAYSDLPGCCASHRRLTQRCVIHTPIVKSPCFNRIDDILNVDHIHTHNPSAYINVHYIKATLISGIPSAHTNDLVQKALKFARLSNQSLDD